MIYPLLRLLYLFLCHIVKICTLREKTPDDPSHVFIAAPLIGTVWMAEENDRALPLPAAGNLNALKVLELAPIIYRDGFE